jgi:hypothetical protein
MALFLLAPLYLPVAWLIMNWSAKRITKKTKKKAIVAVANRELAAPLVPNGSSDSDA